jgi:transposase
MYSIGLDISDKFFTATSCTYADAAFSFQWLARDFSQDDAGFQAFLDTLQTHGIDAPRCHIIMEATGIYSEAISRFLFERGFAVFVEPPLKVKRAFYERGKSDPVDSRQIAEYGFRFADKLHAWQPRETLIDTLAALLSTREALTVYQAGCKATLKGLLKKPNAEILTTIYEKNIDDAKARIKEVDALIDAQIASNPRIFQTYEHVCSIPHVGRLLALNLLLITDGFTAHVNHRQLAAYIGICPFEHQSGSSVYRRPHSDAAGPARLRKLLYLASMRMRAYFPDFKEYYLRKTAEGKSGKLVLNNIANKALKLICGVIRNGKPYLKTFSSQKI